ATSVMPSAADGPVLSSSGGYTIDENVGKSVNFRTLITLAGNKIDVAIPVESFRVISERSSYARAVIELRDDMELRDTIVEECPKYIGLGEAKNLKKPSQAHRGVPPGPKVGFKPTKQVYRPISIKPTVNDGENKKKGAKPIIE
nr:hypothetical protein [Tanacetum cinerariifolium]